MKHIYWALLLLFLATGCASSSGPLVWKFKTGREVASSPAIGADGTVYIGSHDNYFYALAPDRTLKWKVQAGLCVHSSRAIANDGTLDVGAYDNNVDAGAPDGTIKWKASLGRIIESSPALGHDG